MSIPLLFRALSFTLIVNLRTLVAFVHFNGYSPRAFSDWDEPLYLSLAYERAKVPLQSLITLRSGTLEAHQILQSQIPHEILDVLVGRFFTVIGISPVAAGLLLDIVCCLAAYLLLRLLFQRTLGISGVESEIGAVIAIQFPWLGSLGELFPVPLPFLNTVTTVAHGFFPSQPVLRAVYTQVGFIFYLAALVPALSALRTGSYPLQRAVMSGFVVGLAMYIYFFAWGALLVFVGTVCLLDGVLMRPHLKGRIALWGVIFGATALLISLPGLRALFNDGSLYRPGPGAQYATPADLLHFRDFWFFSPIGGALLLVAGACAYKRRSPVFDTYTVCLLLVCVLYVTELLLMNLQPVLGRWLSPYHFSLFYLHPTLSAVLVLMLSLRIARNPRLRLAPPLLIIVASILLGINGVRGVLGDDIAHREEIELYENLARKTPENALVISMPFDILSPRIKAVPDYLIRPYNIEALSRRRSFSKFMGFDANRAEFVRREELLGALYLGERRMLVSCCSEPCAIEYSDIMTGAQAYLSAQRIVDCRLSVQMSVQPVDCRLVSTLENAYLIWDWSQGLKKPYLLQGAELVIWRGESGRIELLELQRKIMGEIFRGCYAD